jgi:hypothetical protein
MCKKCKKPEHLAKNCQSERKSRGDRNYSKKKAACWILGSIPLLPMSYLLMQDGPEILLWDQREEDLWLRDNDHNFTLHDFQYSIGARWHVGYKAVIYGLLIKLDGRAARFLCTCGSLGLRYWRLPGLTHLPF